MMIHEMRTEAEALKEIRVKIPASLHVKLHSIRVLRGKSISDAVAEALEHYFETFGRATAEAAASAAARHGSRDGDQAGALARASWR